MLRGLPALTRGGLATIVIGFAADVVEHTIVSHAGEPSLVGFPVTQHLAHLIVVIGMTLVLAGIVASGRRPQGRGLHGKGADSNAIR